MQRHAAILGLGSNMGDRIGFLSSAVSALKNILHELVVSPVYSSDAELPADADESYQQPFYNMAVKGHTFFTPADLLKQLREIEKEIGFHNHSRKWAPREIDIDILTYDQVMMETPSLTLPHPHLLKRPFALLPLLDLAPDWQCPKSGIRAQAIVAEWEKKGVPFGTKRTKEKVAA